MIYTYSSIDDQALTECPKKNVGRKQPFVCWILSCCNCSCSKEATRYLTGEVLGKLAQHRFMDRLGRDPLGNDTFGFAFPSVPSSTQYSIYIYTAWMLPRTLQHWSSNFTNTRFTISGHTSMYNPRHLFAKFGIFGCSLSHQILHCTQGMFVQQLQHRVDSRDHRSGIRQVQTWHIQPHPTNPWVEVEARKNTPGWLGGMCDEAKCDWFVVYLYIIFVVFKCHWTCRFSCC